MLNTGCKFSADGRQYTVLDTLGKGANTAAFLAECRYGGLATRCILKEYVPHNSDAFEKGKARFISSGRLQNKLRQITALNNQTPPVSHVFEANGTAYIDVACYSGKTLNKLDDLTLPQYMAICRTIAKTVGYYHRAGLLCLDLKPENIFILQNAPNDTITQLVEFIDFDSVREIGEIDSAAEFSYTREWSAPEQQDPYSVKKLSCAADIYAVGEIAFYLLFGRHSTESEHRGFSKYPFEECKREYRKYVERPDIRKLFTELFRNSIRSSAANRFSSIDEAEELLGRIVTEMERKDYIIPVLPFVSPDFVGRDTELRQIAESLSREPVLYITGIGGIGKSTLIKNFISRHRTEYDVIVYLEYDGDIRHTFSDDMQLQISTVSRQDGEPLEAYYSRKLTAFRRICGEKRVLFVIDNYTDRLTKELSRIIDCGYDTIIAARNRPPKNSIPFIEITAISEAAELFRLISLNLERPLTKEERLCFEEIITIVQGHTLVLELIARQIAAGRLDVHTALELIRKNGFSRFSEEKVGNVKDGEEVCDTLSAIISALFDTSLLDASAGLVMKILSLLNVRGLEISLLQRFFPDIRTETVSWLSDNGWLCDDNRVRLHPVIAETMRAREWSADDISVMEYHKKMIDIYGSMSNDTQMREILREAEIFKAQHPRHIIAAMYCDMLGSYYDTLQNGAYLPENDREAELLQKIIVTVHEAIRELQCSADPHKTKYLIRNYLDLAGILLRSVPENYDEAEKLLGSAYELIADNEPDISENRCYYCMISAWYYTLAEPDLNKMKALTKRAEEIARQVFPTDLELIDIIYIPTANCFYYHCGFEGSVSKLNEAVEICSKYPDALPYIDKKAELLSCMLDVYFEMKEHEMCRKIIADIDEINDRYESQGIHREVSEEIREYVKLVRTQ